MKVYDWSRERYSGTPWRTARTAGNICNVIDLILSHKTATRRPTLQTMRLRHLRLCTATCIPEPVNDNAFFEAWSSVWSKSAWPAAERFRRSPIDEIWAIFAKIWNCFWSLVLRDPLYKTLFFDYWFRSPNPQNWLPKIWQKNRL